MEKDETNPQEPKITGKITDFGLSHILGSAMETSSSSSYARRWQAPELAWVEEKDPTEREKYLEKADVWSFALTSLEVLMQIR